MEVANRMAEKPNQSRPQANILPPQPGDSPQPTQTTFDDKWLEIFYRECGREITLAYTTLNQMKNWAILTAAAAISGMAFSTAAETYPNLPMFTGTVIVYAFVLRFFIRAIVCYTNLIRWNKLQSSCLNLKLIQTAVQKQEIKKKLEEDIRNYYYLWLSPLNRKSQLIQNLKLGFMLLFTLVLFFLVWGAIALWNEPIVRGLAIWVFGASVLELYDFSRASIFDDVKAYERKKAGGKVKAVFPVPESSRWFLARWLTVLLLSIVIAAWPDVYSTVKTLLQGLLSRT